MIVALTGTPGTGKTSVAEILRRKGFEVIDINKVAIDQGFVVGKDKLRDTNIVDTDLLNRYICKKYKDYNLVFIEGHLSHLLNCADKVIILRCNPKKLRENLSKRGWKEEKIKENVEAEILDIILCEAIDIHNKNDIIEIDVSEKSAEDVAKEIIEIVNRGFKNIGKYKIGSIDWSEEILKEDFKQS